MRSRARRACAPPTVPCPTTTSPASPRRDSRRPAHRLHPRSPPAATRGCPRSDSPTSPNRGFRPRERRMPSRFIVSCAARAVGMTSASPASFEIDEHLGRDRLDLRHDHVRPLLLDEPAQRCGIRHVDDVGAMRDLVARRVGVAVDGDRLHPEALERDDDFLAELPAAEQHDAGGGRGQRGADGHGGSRSEAPFYAFCAQHKNERPGHGLQGGEPPRGPRPAADS